MTKNSASAHRREFLKTSSAAVAGTLAAMALPRAVHAAGSDMLKVGLIGCGGRGTGAAAQALKADPNVKLWAMGDAFEDRLELEPQQPAEDRKKSPARSTCRAERRFVGFDAYKQVIDCCDVVLLCTPPHFRPLHLEAAVDAGKHVFAEKPVAVDAPGVRSVLATCEEAKQKDLSIVSGLCLRYDYGFRRRSSASTTARSARSSPCRPTTTAAPIWVKPRKPEWSDMNWQMRNWYYFTWLSRRFQRRAARPLPRHVRLG